MSFRVDLPPTFTDRIAESTEGLIGIFVSSGSATNAEILAATGYDWLFIDAEHSPYSLETVLELLRAVAVYDTVPVVRLPVNDTALIKQYLDLGAQNLMVPMVNTQQDAERAARAMHYPPRGVRGIGSALARASRYNAVDSYLSRASDTVSLIAQIETGEAIRNAAAIAAVDDVDALFIGPSDLAADLGYIGQQDHPEVLEAIAEAFEAVKSSGKPIGINAFNPQQAKEFLDQGADFVSVGADVQQLGMAARNLLSQFKGE